MNNPERVKIQSSLGPDSPDRVWTQSSEGPVKVKIEFRKALLVLFLSCFGLGHDCFCLGLCLGLILVFVVSPCPDRVWLYRQGSDIVQKESIDSRDRVYTDRQNSDRLLVLVFCLCLSLIKVLVLIWL